LGLTFARRRHLDAQVIQLTRARWSAREMRPGIRVLLTSGYAEELVQGHDLQRERLKVLRKPYQQAELVAALRDVLRDTSR